MKAQFDIAIIGSGFGGALLAMLAHRAGRSVVLLEKSQHPRFVIGESSTPLANLLLEELATRYDLPRLLPLCKWGAWQAAYPEIGCGLKRGFTFYHHTFEQRFAAQPDRSNQLLVAASPNDEIGDTHWYRPDFDHFLVQEAQNLGVEYCDNTALQSMTHNGVEHVLAGTRAQRNYTWRARLVIDASGPRGFLHHTLRLSEMSFPNMPPTQGLYTHFRGVHKLAALAEFATSTAPPYPIDDAAVHHVFDGGWMWVLRFNNGLTSAGVAATASLARAMHFAEGAPAWQRLLKRLPSLAAQFENAAPQFRFIHAPQLAFCSREVVGRQWALLPSAAGFVDPLLSTGFPLTLLGVARLAELIAKDWGTERFVAGLQNYARQTHAELRTAAGLIAALYASMHDFSLFAPLTLLYFAAASFSETARRLGRAHLARTFLLYDHPHFGPHLRACVQRAHSARSSSEKNALLEQIYHALAPLDVAGLSDRQRRNWYPVRAEDLFAATDKLGVTTAALADLLRRSGFPQ